MTTQLQAQEKNHFTQPTHSLDAFCRQFVDLGFITIILALPFLMGGRHPLGQLVLVGTSILIALAWSLSQMVRRHACWRWTGAEILILAALGVGVLQIVPLPPELLYQISPRLAELLPLWNSSDAATAGLGRWTQLSLNPSATQSAIVILMSFALLFVVFAQRVRQVTDMERFLRWLAAATVGMAAFGLIQFFTSNGKFFWVYEHPYTNTSWFVKGSFTNRNHFTQFLAVGLGPLIWWFLKVLHRTDDPKSSWGSHAISTRKEILLGGLGIAIGTVLFAGLLSLSRGGIIAMGVALTTMLLACGSKKLISGKLVGAMVLIGMLLTAYLSFHGYEAIAKRMGNWEASHRALIWQANLEMTKDFPIVGTGWATHRHTYPIYLDAPVHDREFTHAESSVLQIASESGLVGIGLTAMAVLLCLFWTVRGLALSQNESMSLLQAAILSSLAASVVHACFDFVWHVPACLLPVVLLAASAGSLKHTQTSRESKTDEYATAGMPVPQFVWGAAVACCLLAGFWMMQIQFPVLAAETDLHQYQLLTQTNRESDDAVVQSFSKAKFAALRRALHANPNDTRLQLRVAKGYLAMFHLLQQQNVNPLPLAQIRDAAQQSQFESPKALEQWLERALGNNKALLEAAAQHARKALQLCPLEGRGYIYYSDLAFILPQISALSEAQILDQAERVRPTDPGVLFAVGKQAWLAGESELAFEKWHNAFHQKEVHQQRIIELLAPVIDADMFLEKFQPDWLALKRVTHQYQALNKKQDAKLLLEKLAEASVVRARKLENREAIRTWLIARDAYAALGQQELVIKSLEEALKVDPYSVSIRHALGSWLFKYGRIQEADEHLQWCARQKPHDQNLQQLAAQVQQQRTKIASDHSQRRIF